MESTKRTPKKKEVENDNDAISDFNVTIVSPGRDIPRHAFAELKNILNRRHSFGSRTDILTQHIIISSDTHKSFFKFSRDWNTCHHQTYGASKYIFLCLPSCICLVKRKEVGLGGKGSGGREVGTRKDAQLGRKKQVKSTLSDRFGF
jgi:hypothetical protein